MNTYGFDKNLPPYYCNSTSSFNFDLILSSACDFAAVGPI